MSSINYTLIIFLEDKQKGKYEKILEKEMQSISACAQISDMILSSANTKKYNVYFVVKTEEKNINK